MTAGAAVLGYLQVRRSSRCPAGVRTQTALNYDMPVTWAGGGLPGRIPPYQCNGHVRGDLGAAGRLRKDPCDAAVRGVKLRFNSAARVCREHVMHASAGDESSPAELG